MAVLVILMLFKFVSIETLFSSVGSIANFFLVPLGSIFFMYCSSKLQNQILREKHEIEVHLNRFQNKENASKEVHLMFQKLEEAIVIIDND